MEYHHAFQNSSSGMGHQSKADELLQQQEDKIKKICREEYSKPKK